jgi:hypothetical protein
MLIFLETNVTLYIYNLVILQYRHGKLTKYKHHKVDTRLKIISCYWKYETVQVKLQNFENLNFQVRLQNLENLNLQVELEARIMASWALRLSL